MIGQLYESKAEIVTVDPGVNVPLLLLNTTFGLLDETDQLSIPLALAGLLKTYGQDISCPTPPWVSHVQLVKLLILEVGLSTIDGGTCATVGVGGVGCEVGVVGIGTGVVA